MRFIINKEGLTEEQAVELIQTPYQTVSVDIETVSLLNPLPLGIAVGISADIGLYFFNPQDEYLHTLIDHTPCIILHNASFDLPILARLGYTIQTYEDTMLMAYSSGILELSLEHLSLSVLHRSNPSVTDQWKEKDQGNIGINHVTMGSISIIHACNTYALWGKLPKTDLYNDIDKPCIELILEMEKNGLLIDQYQLTQVEQSVVERATSLEKELKLELGDINLASSTQLLKALQAKGILGTRKTKGGKESTSEESLKPLNDPIANKVLKWRSERKTISTYIPAFRSVDNNGRIHTVFGYTNTGRWRSGDKEQGKTNLQNLTRDEKFEEVKDAS